MARYGRSRKVVHGAQTVLMTVWFTELLTHDIDI